MRDLDSRFRRLEEALDRLNGKTPQVTIENVHIHQPVLEKLEFRLDGLDIEHLSGSLNLGNNFGTKLTETTKKPSQPHADSKIDGGAAAQHAVTDAARPGVQKTASGFRINNRR